MIFSIKTTGFFRWEKLGPGTESPTVPDVGVPVKHKRSDVCLGLFRSRQKKNVRKHQVYQNVYQRNLSNEIFLISELSINLISDLVGFLVGQVSRDVGPTLGLSEAYATPTSQGRRSASWRKLGGGHQYSSVMFAFPTEMITDSLQFVITSSFRSCLGQNLRGCLCFCVHGGFGGRF